MKQERKFPTKETTTRPSTHRHMQTTASRTLAAVGVVTQHFIRSTIQNEAKNGRVLKRDIDAVVKISLYNIFEVFFVSKINEKFLNSYVSFLEFWKQIEQVRKVENTIIKP